MLDETAKYLQEVSTSAGLVLSRSTLLELEARIGTCPALGALPWI